MLKERHYSISAVQDEVRALVTRGSVGRRSQIYSLARYFNDGEWKQVEHVLEDHDYCLRDSVCDLIGKESWLSD